MPGRERIKESVERVMCLFAFRLRAAFLPNDDCGVIRRNGLVEHLPRTVRLIEVAAHGIKATRHELLSAADGDRAG